MEYPLLKEPANKLHDVEQGREAQRILKRAKGCDFPTKRKPGDERVHPTSRRTWIRPGDHQSSGRSSKRRLSLWANHCERFRPALRRRIQRRHGFDGECRSRPICAFFVRGEYQHASATASYDPQVQNAIANADGTLPFSNGTASIDRFRLLDSAVSFTFHNYQFSFGKQSLWMGPPAIRPLLLATTRTRF